MRELAIVILHHNTPQDVEENLKSISEADLPENTAVVVVNNGGNKANEKINKKAFNLDVKFFEVPNDGFPAGNNFGMKQVEAKYYAFVNPDIVVEKNVFVGLLDYLKKNKKVAIVSPKLIYRDGSVQDNYRVFPRILDLIIKRIKFLRKLFPSRMRTYLMWDREPNQDEAVDWVTGAFMVMSREFLQKVGNHDEYYFLFMSDVAICREAYKLGKEVHIVGSYSCLHDDERVSGGGVKDIFRKKIMRIHIKDAIKYFWKYKFEKIPKDAPSVSRVEKKKRLLKSYKISGRSFLSNLNKKLQKDNPVVSVYEAQIDARSNYKQPVVFFDTGVVAVLKNEKGEFGLIKIWRHTPLQFTKSNAFPVFPDVGDLGMWSYECVRGGREKVDKSYEEAILRELDEEVGLKKAEVLEINRLGSSVANTAIDVFRHINFEVKVKDFKFKVNSDEESISELRWFDKKKISEMIRKEQIFCGISQAALLESILLEEK